MRPRIKNRVNIEESILEMKRRKDAYTSAIKDIMASEGLAYAEAKGKLMSSLKWKAMTRQMSALC
jgi:hypothetical protein